MKLIITTIIKHHNSKHYKKNIDEWLILPNNTILLMKSQLITSYTLKHDVNRCFWNPAWSKCKHVYKPVGSFINNRVSSIKLKYCVIKRISHYSIDAPGQLLKVSVVYWAPIVMSVPQKALKKIKCTRQCINWVVGDSFYNAIF
jgi:hypothetical protein